MILGHNVLGVLLIRCLDWACCFFFSFFLFSSPQSDLMIYTQLFSLIVNACVCVCMCVCMCVCVCVCVYVCVCMHAHFDM